MNKHTDFREREPLYNRIKLWRDEEDLRAGSFDEYKTLSLKEIFEAFDKLHAQTPAEDTPEARERERRLDALKVLISIRLGLFDTSRATYLYDVINETIWANILEMDSQFKELTQQFKKHRHCLDKTYGETPVW